MTRLAWSVVLSLAAGASLTPLPGTAAIDARVRTAMADTHANGMAIAVIDDGRVAYAQANGIRNAKGDPLQTDTVMYGASLTKTVMAYTTLTLVDKGTLDLDAPLAGYLERPLTSYGEGEAHLAKYPQGPGFFKSGHDGQTANSFVCLERGRRCVLLLAKCPCRNTLRRSGALRARRHRRPLRLGIW